MYLRILWKKVGTGCRDDGKDGLNQLTDHPEICPEKRLG
jgi:hypothetical protein